jgi:hypothetical protein
MRVYPKAGLKVRGPDGRLLPDSGLDVKESDLFWARRLRDGDVMETAPTTTNASASASPATRSGSSE